MADVVTVSTSCSHAAGVTITVWIAQMGTTKAGGRVLKVDGEITDATKVSAPGWLGNKAESTTVGMRGRVTCSAVLRLTDFDTGTLQLC